MEISFSSLLVGVLHASLGTFYTVKLAIVAALVWIFLKIYYCG
jgi:hypothetical protein